MRNMFDLPAEKMHAARLNSNWLRSTGSSHWMAKIMLNKQQNLLALVARVLIALIFLLSGLHKIGNFGSTSAYIASVGLPLPAAGTVLAIVIEVAGALALIFGFYTRAVAAIMAVFTVIAAVCFHNFWAMTGSAVAVNQIMFLKNISIAGGLLMLAVSGAGGLSLDSRRHSNS